MFDDRSSAYTIKTMSSRPSIGEAASTSTTIGLSRCLPPRFQRRIFRDMYNMVKPLLNNALHSTKAISLREAKSHYQALSLIPAIESAINETSLSANSDQKFSQIEDSLSGLTKAVTALIDGNNTIVPCLTSLSNDLNEMKSKPSYEGMTSGMNSGNESISTDNVFTNSGDAGNRNERFTAVSQNSKSARIQNPNEFSHLIRTLRVVLESRKCPR